MHLYNIITSFEESMYILGHMLGYALSRAALHNAPAFPLLISADTKTLVSNNTLSISPMWISHVTLPLFLVLASVEGLRITSVS